MLSIHETLTAYVKIATRVVSAAHIVELESFVKQHCSDAQNHTFRKIPVPYVDSNWLTLHTQYLN